MEALLYIERSWDSYVNHKKLLRGFIQFYELLPTQPGSGDKISQ